MERSAEASKTISDERPTATATPEIATARPTLPIIRSMAISTEWWRSSSRKRLTMNSE